VCCRVLASKAPTIGYILSCFFCQGDLIYDAQTHIGIRRAGVCVWSCVLEAPVRTYSCRWCRRVFWLCVLTYARSRDYVFGFDCASAQLYKQVWSLCVCVCVCVVVGGRVCVYGCMVHAAQYASVCVYVCANWVTVLCVNIYRRRRCSNAGST